MNDFERDPADLDGDGEFDAIGISILGEEKDGRLQSRTIVGAVSCLCL